MKLPNTYTNKNETGCCAVPNTTDWNEKEVSFKDIHFIRMYTRSFLFMPLNMSKVMSLIQQQAEQASATVSPKDVMILSRDLSPWKAEQLYAVSKLVKGADNVTLNGTYLTKVFEGPYKNANQWYKDLQSYAKSKKKDVDKTYFFYTTCPKCSKHYGKNFVFGFAGVK